MDDSTRAAPKRSQLRQGQELIRGMARRVGVNLIVWAHVKIDMAALGIDELDILHALQSCRVVGMEVLGSVERYHAMGRDTDGRMLGVLFVLSLELHAVEVVRVSIQEV